MPIYKRGGGSGLPEIAAGDASKVLAVKGDESGVEYVALPADELPTPEEGDAGKVLTVNAEETGYALETPSAGGADEAAVLALLWAFGN